MAPAPPSTNGSSTTANNNNNNSGSRSGSPKGKRKTVTIVSSTVAAALLIFMLVSIVVIIRRSRKKKLAVLRRAYAESPSHDEAITNNSDVYGNPTVPTGEKVYPPSSAPTTNYQKSLSDASIIEVPPPVHFDSSLYNPNPQSIHQASQPPPLQAPGAFHEPYYGFSQSSYGQPDPSGATYQYHSTPHTQFTPK